MRAELLRKLSGKESWEGHDATSVAFSMMADGDSWKQKPILRIEHLELKKKFDLGVQRKMFSFDELLSKRDFLAYARTCARAGADDFNDLEKAALEAYGQMVDLDNAATRVTPHLVPGMDADSPWLSIGDLSAMQNAPFVGGIVAQWADVQTSALGDDPGKARGALALLDRHGVGTSGMEVGRPEAHRSRSALQHDSSISLGLGRVRVRVHSFPSRLHPEEQRSGIRRQHHLVGRIPGAHRWPRGSPILGRAPTPFRICTKRPRSSLGESCSCRFSSRWCIASAFTERWRRLWDRLRSCSPTPCPSSAI
jgi:hypothetical protein